MLVNCKILIFLFFKNAAEMFYAWHNPAIRWVIKPYEKKTKGKKKRKEKSSVNQTRPLNVILI